MQGTCVSKEGTCTKGFITAENPHKLFLKAGQTVEVKAPDQNIFKQALTVLLPPVLSFAAGFTLTHLFFPKAGEGAFAFTGVIFLFAAAFIIYKIRKRKTSGFEFAVTKIIDS
jgi:positive regulator of sigma E activity